MAIIVEWKLDGNSNDTLGVNNGVDTSISYVSGYKGQCASFNGSTSIIKPPAGGVRPTGNFTVNAWINTGTNGRMIYETYSQLSSIVSGFQLNLNGTGKVTLTSGKNTGVTLNVDYKQISGSTTVSTSTWTMVSGVYNGSTLEVFVNGVSDGSVAWTNAPAYQSDSKPSIGANNYQSTTIIDYWNGLIDEVRVYDTAENIAQLYTSYRDNPNFFMFFK